MNASGFIPQISIIAGPCAGGAVYSPGITDFIFMIDKIGLMFITGPKVVKTAMFLDISEEDLGGSKIHTEKSGVAHFKSACENDCFEKVRKPLEYVPHFYGDKNERRNVNFDPTKIESIKKILPLRSNQGYDIRKIINCLIDDNSFFEVHEEFSQNIVIGFAYLEGNTVGIIANQPDILGGILNCDAFDIPLLTLVDLSQALSQDLKRNKRESSGMGQNLFMPMLKLQYPK